MKKIIFFISSISLMLILGILIFKFYTFEDTGSNDMQLRTDSQQDAQVKNNEAMLSNSLTNIVENLNNKKEEKQIKPIDNPSITQLANNSSEKK